MSGVRSFLPSLDAILLKDRTATHDSSIVTCLWPDELDSHSPSLRSDKRMHSWGPPDESTPGGTSSVEAGTPSEAARRKQRSTSGNTILTRAAGGARRIPQIGLPR
eukprot:1868226-Amphidinium_carterae.1